MKPPPRSSRDVSTVARPHPTLSANPHTTQSAPHGVMLAVAWGRQKIKRPLHSLTMDAVPLSPPGRLVRLPPVCRSPHVCLAVIWSTPHPASPLSLPRPTHHDRDCKVHAKPDGQVLGCDSDSITLTKLPCLINAALLLPHV